MIKVRFLGTGTSTGVPQIGCTCPVCTSTDLHDKRLRASVLLTVNGKNLLIDCGPDFRSQIISAGAPPIDAALLTHSHYDHVGGIDDLRPYCRVTDGFDLYCREDVARDLHARVPYCFKKHPYPGVPIFNIHVIDDRSFRIGDIDITPLPVIHYRLHIYGFRIGDFAYITDAKHIPDTTFELLEGVDTLVINALRKEEHLSHMNLEQALDAIGRIRPRVAYLTHIADKLGLSSEVGPTLPDGVKLAYDNLEISVPDTKYQSIN